MWKMSEKSPKRFIMSLAENKWYPIYTERTPPFPTMNGQTSIPVGMQIMPRNRTVTFFEIVETCSAGVARLVEETETHVLVGLLGLLLLLLLGRGIAAGSTASSRGTTTTTATRGDGGELGSTLSNDLVDILVLELADEGVQALIIGLDTDRLEDGLDIGSRGRLVAAEGKEKVGSDVLHLDSCCAMRLLVLLNIETVNSLSRQKAY
jgi:hypothetical protein